MRGSDKCLHARCGCGQVFCVEVLNGHVVRVGVPLRCKVFLYGRLLFRHMLYFQVTYSQTLGVVGYSLLPLVVVAPFVSVFHYIVWIGFLIKVSSLPVQHGQILPVPPSFPFPCNLPSDKRICTF